MTVKACSSSNGYLLVFFPFSPSAASSTHQILPVLPLPSQPSSSPPTIHSNYPAATSLPSFSVPIHHVASFLNVNPLSLFDDRLHHDAVRVQALTALASRNHSSTTGFSSLVTSGLPLGEYFARFGIGTPPRYLYMVLDTGSDVVWLQCEPCRKCYSQTDRLFNPSKSKSYSVIPAVFPLAACSTLTAQCIYTL